MAAERRTILRTLHRSVRIRITAAAVLVVGVALLVGAVALVLTLQHVLVREERASAMLRAAEAAQVVHSGRDPAAAVAGDDDLVLQVVSASGQVWSATPNVAGGPPVVALAVGDSRIVDVPFDDDPFVVAAVAADDGQRVLLGLSLDTVGATTGALTAMLAVGLPVLLGLVGLTTWRVIGRTLAPVEAMRAEVDLISATELHRRVPGPESGDEIGRLAATMNRMLDRLERGRTRERQFVADASHELRSPIAAIRQRAEVTLRHPSLIDGLAETALTESRRMQALVDDLLLLARADERTLASRRRPVDVDDLVLDEARRLRASGTVMVDATGVGAARVDGDEATLRRVVGNLADNAVRHARGRVGLSLAALDGWAVLRVDDDGPGIPQADRGRVFERFVRLDDARGRDGGSSGLGLSIVAEIVAAHGGTATVEDAGLGGARVTVRLPLLDG